MKNLKIKLPFLTLLLGLGIVFVQSAFTAKPSSRLDTYWSYNPGDDSAIREGESYTKITDPDENSCPPGFDLPCVLTTPESVVSNEDLEDYLKDTDTFPTDASITSSATHKKISD